MSAETAAPPVPVLLVDDHAAFRAAARLMLESGGRFAVVAEAGTGEEAVQTALALQPRLVLMDVRLPGIDGVEATRRIKEALPGTVVVLMSTHRPADLPPGLDECGAAAFQRKEDVEPEALLDVL
ncbi:MAG: response regulator transcription factor [Actinomycetes bacterium]